VHAGRAAALTACRGGSVSSTADGRTAALRRARAARVVAAAMLCLAAWAPSAVLAQDVIGPDPGVRVFVSSLTGVLGPGSVPPLGPEDVADPRPAPTTLEVRMLVEHRGEIPLDQVRAVVEIHPAVETRAELHDALDGGLSTAPMHVHDLPVRDGAALQPGEVAGIADAFPPDEVAWAADGGVHPVRAAIVRGTQVLDEVVTAVVWLPEVPVAPLRTVLVWPLDAAPNQRVGDVHDAGLTRAVEPGGRIDALLRPLERLPDAPVTLAPAAHLLEELRDRADGFTLAEPVGPTEQQLRRIDPEEREARLANDALQRIRRLANVLPFDAVAGTFADADLPGLLAADRTAELRDLASRAAVEGPRRLQQVLETDTDATTHLVSGHVTAGALDLLPAGQVIVPRRAVDPPAGTDVLLPLQSAAGRSLTALVADERLSGLLSTTRVGDDPLLVAQTVRASSAMLYLERTEANDRVLVVSPDPWWDPGTPVASQVLEALVGAPWLDPVSPATLGNIGRRSSAAATVAEPPDALLSAELADLLGQASRDLSVATGALPEGTSTIDGHRPDALADALLRATSHWLLWPDPEPAESLVDDVRRVLDRSFGTVAIDQTRITLTSDTGSIPVTLERTDGPPVSVVVEVASPGRLAWPEGRRSTPLVLEPGSRQTVTFATEARSTGTFPVTVRVTDPTGQHDLASTTLSVRSTALSRPALVATGAIVLVLLAIGLVRRGTPRRRLRVVTSSVEQSGPGER
jgi:hypothetical protein